MRVALVGPYPLDPNRLSGGVETSFANLLEGLLHFDDVEPHVFSFITGAKAPSRAAESAFPVHYLPSPGRLNNLTLHRSHRRLLAPAIAELRPDLVHAQDSIAYGYTTLRAVRGLPVVLSIHGIVREEIKFMPRRYDRFRTWATGPPIQRYCVRHARYLIEPSRYPEEYFGELVRGHIFDVGNPIADRFFEASPAPEPSTLLYAGGITPGKRVLDLIDVLAALSPRLPGARLRIAGHTDNTEYVAAVRERARTLGVDARVTLLGGLSPGEMVEEYRRAAVFVLASGQENSPMVIAEAMAVGVPVVATRVGGVHSLVVDEQTGFMVEVGDIAGFAERVAGLLESEPTRAAFAAAARARAESRFRSIQVAERVRAVYRQMLGERDVGAAAAGAGGASGREDDR